jgi:hypothetical protein
LRREKYMIENGFDFGVRLAVAAVAVAGLACTLFVGVAAAAVLLAVARRLYRGGDDDAAVAAKKEHANEGAAWRRGRRAAPVSDYGIHEFGDNCLREAE